MSTLLLPVSQAELEVPSDATADDIDAAVAASVEAGHGSWPRDHRRRAAVMLAWADRIEAEQDELVEQLVCETGKIVTEARAEVSGSIDALRFNAGLCRLPLGRAASLWDGSESHLVREPVGPTVFITPWNWPVLLLLRDLAPALAAGVTALVKPSPQTHHVTEHVLRLGHASGVDEDVLQCLPGGAAVGSALVRHPGTAAVAITGSTTAGQAVMRDAAETMTRPLLELGGKGSMLVLPDGDLERALASAARASVTTAGQMCMACTRVLVHQDHLAEACARLTDLMGSLRVGDPHDPQSDLGPLISGDAFAKVTSYVELARRDATVLVGGERLRPPGSQGYFLAPALVTDVERSSPIVQDDIFGPVLTVEAYRDESDAIGLVNAAPYGLASSVWSRDLGRALSVARAIKAGTVWVNGYNRSYAEAPSGGYGMSGLGRTRGLEGVEQFTEVKHVHFSL
ncbi:aldehyde dehydrogenase [Intrasporangium chromatireducens Q5-1]|uniref:aldehyde dehydrogenase (NAD(+)) n=1 Tax=Intrasporangium chromatireducens Q5-1 TaxID=584657 RepID=W9GG97_9MICO|nr:aldehyde dehydrogenase family protein [Intrasporangium chromatireducens]EWT04212.1 aldehyde dehydrogenase [Intrasporangium chromatireducens Q5-1]